MRYELAVGESGTRSGIPHLSARGLSSPRPTNSYHATKDKPCSARPLRPVTEGSPITNHQSLPTVHRRALRPIAGSQIRALLIDTLPIRNASNSFLLNKCAYSNRHSSETISCAQFSGKCSHIATRTTRLEVLFSLWNPLCYSFLVTRVPPNGLRASAPARSHGCGVDVSLPRDVRTTGAFPHKFTYSTGLMGPASFVLRDWPGSPFGFRSPESPVGDAGVKESSCES
jgi:hypothetical protein